MNTQHICPELLAAKCEQIRNGQHPRFAKAIQQCRRLMEVLWHVQDASHQAGGLPTFSETLCNEDPGAFVTRAMVDAGPPTEGKWSLEQCLKVWAAPYGQYWNWHHRQFLEWRDSTIAGDEMPDGLRARWVAGDASVRDGFGRFNYDYFHTACLSAARAELPRLLASWCEPGSDFWKPWWCADILGAIVRCIDRHADRVGKTIAPTNINRIIFRELDFSLSERLPVQFVGGSRFGKTKSASVCATMSPGRCRLVLVPPENRQLDFLNAHAEALHYRPKKNASVGKLDRAIKFIISNSGLFFLYDESQWLLPVSYKRGTKPSRLNWIRSHLIDAPGAGGCAFFATKQSYEQDLNQFVTKTGYVMEQWLGRMAPIVTLPEALDFEDLLAVGSLNFPDIPSELLELISTRAMQSEGLLHHFEIVAKRARFIAREHGRISPDLSDIEQAITDMLPRALPARGNASAEPVQDSGCARAADAPPIAGNRLSPVSVPALAAG